MNVKEVTDLVKQEWMNADGFLLRACQGQYDAAGLERLIKILQSVELENEERFDSQFVQAVWCIPILLEWNKKLYQKDRQAAAVYREAIYRLTYLIWGIFARPHTFKNGAAVPGAVAPPERVGQS